LCLKGENEFENIKCECDDKKEICENCNSNEELIKKIQNIEKKLFIIENLIQSEYFTKSINSLLELKPLLPKNHILLLRLNKLIGELKFEYLRFLKWIQQLDCYLQIMVHRKFLYYFCKLHLKSMIFK
jgi:K+/H+ antiporter YhaU regulatory subunit KhtT